MEAEAFFATLKEHLSLIKNRADRFAIELLFREAVENAIEHGGLFDPRQCISIDIRLFDDHWLAVVSDSGQGFDLARVMAERKIGGERGHGFFIFDEFASEHHWEDGGRSIHFTRRFGEPD